MSRRRRESEIVEPIDGQIRLKCPHGHRVGAVLLSPRRPVGPQALYLLDAELRRGTDSVSSQRLQPGLPLRVICHNCRLQQTGRYWYEAPWQQLDRLLQELSGTWNLSLTLC